MAVDGRRCNSGASYSRAAMVKVMAMLPPTMSAIATQKSMKIRRKRLCMGAEEHEDPRKKAMHGRRRTRRSAEKGYAWVQKNMKIRREGLFMSPEEHEDPQTRVMHEPR